MASGYILWCSTSWCQWNEERSIASAFRKLKWLQFKILPLPYLLLWIHNKRPLDVFCGGRLFAHWWAILRKQTQFASRSLAAFYLLFVARPTISTFGGLACHHFAVQQHNLRANYTLVSIRIDEFFIDGWWLFSSHAKWMQATIHTIPNKGPTPNVFNYCKLTRDHKGL